MKIACGNTSRFHVIFKHLLFLVIGESCHKCNFCHNKCFVMTSMCLSWQTCVCHNKHIFCHDKSRLVVTKVFCHNNFSCCNKQFCHVFVMTKLCLLRQNICRNKHNFVATKILNMILLQQKLCHDKHIFVATKDMFCHDKNYPCGSSPKRYFLGCDSIWMHSCGAGLIGKHNCAMLTEPDTNEDMWKTGNIQYGAVKGYGNQHNNSRMLWNCGNEA